MEGRDWAAEVSAKLAAANAAREAAADLVLQMLEATGEETFSGDLFTKEWRQVSRTTSEIRVQRRDGVTIHVEIWAEAE